MLPDYGDDYAGAWNGNAAGAPVTLDGSPVYYSVPESFQKAKNDGQRWRWALAQAVETDPGLLNTTRVSLADVPARSVRHSDHGWPSVRPDFG